MFPLVFPSHFDTFQIYQVQMETPDFTPPSVFTVSQYHPSSGSDKIILVTSDSSLSLVAPIQSVSKPSWFYLQNTHRIQPLPISTPFIQVQATVISHLDDWKIHVSVSLLLPLPPSPPTVYSQHSNRSDYLKIRIRSHYSSAEYSAAASMPGTESIYNVSCSGQPPRLHTVLIFLGFTPTCFHQQVRILLSQGLCPLSGMKLCSENIPSSQMAGSPSPPFLLKYLLISVTFPNTLLKIAFEHH